MSEAIAIVGLACRYPDANSPAELWENVLHQRRAFRRIPPERLNLDEYWSSDPAKVDCTYVTQGAFLKNYDFDRIAFRVSGDTYRATDLTHWLALDVASSALADAGFPNGEGGLRKESTGVYLGNTLAGEFSRAGILRQRWPYVRRVITATLQTESWDADRIAEFLARMERAYKDPFPEPGAESLVGGLANTIAGRICNYFDFQGGGFTLDGACASSLLAVIQACSALREGDVDAAIAGGVDLSLDPFELVGFARVGALAKHSMKIYDRDSVGFLPGEGCGLAVLMRHEDAIATHRRIYAVIRGFGISSDGSGGMTRPEVGGQALALERAYRRAGFDIGSVGYFEGHGTGTEVGDAVELRALTDARRKAGALDLAPIGSIKANIGHTKAAAGAAGMIKAVMAVWQGVLPPTTGCENPHAELTDPDPKLRILDHAEPWDSKAPRRAGVSAMGFGGINTHVVLESATAPAAGRLKFVATPQDAELFVFSSPDLAGLSASLETFMSEARGLSLSEFSDAAAEGHRSLARASYRAAIVASSPEQLFDRLSSVRKTLEEGRTARFDPSSGIFLDSGETQPRIGLLFPGQAAPVRRSAGAIGKRFAGAKALYDSTTFPDGPSKATSVAQPAIVAASLSALCALEELGIRGDVSVGHSLGEITALCWAGAIERDAAIRIATARGAAMMSCPSPGSMATIGAPVDDIAAMAAEHNLDVAAINGPRQTVVSGPSNQIAEFAAAARVRGWPVMILPVSHAFHSVLMKDVSALVGQCLSGEKISAVSGTVFSTVTGTRLEAEADLHDLLVRQVTNRVEFESAATMAARQVDLFIEAGPGSILSDLVSSFLLVPAISLDAGAESFRALLLVAGACFALGTPVKLPRLSRNRVLRPYQVGGVKRFLTNPCESTSGIGSCQIAGTSADATKGASHTHEAAGNVDSPVEIVRRILAEHCELPVASVRDEHRLLSDLHLNSITVTQLVAKAAQQIGSPPPVMPTGFANVTVAEVAKVLLQTAEAAPHQPRRRPTGLIPWVRCFTSTYVPSPASAVGKSPRGLGNWRLFIADDHPWKSELMGAFTATGSGVVVCLEPDCGDMQYEPLLRAARTLQQRGDRFVLVHHGSGSAAFARSVRLEYPQVDVCVVRLPIHRPDLAALAYEEAIAVREFDEIWYDDAGDRLVPRLDTMPIMRAKPPVLRAGDVLLVSGGAKGLGAECGMAAVRGTGARLLLLGRSDPKTDDEVARNLCRFDAAGICYRYIRADVTDAASTAAAIDEGRRALGDVTAVMHAAGRNAPALIESLTSIAFRETLAPKVGGLQNILGCLDPIKLRLLVSFGSVLGRMGMRGNSDYAFANERLRVATDDWAARNPQCRCLTLEWSIWCGIGLGERLGSVEVLAQAGISAITPEEGTTVLSAILSDSCSGSMIVASRFSSLPHLRFSKPDPPLLRFVERVHSFVPRVEIVADSTIGPRSDPYLLDHVLDGVLLFPAALGIEAMAQAAFAVTGENAGHWMDLAFERPILVPRNGTTVLRTYASVRGDGTLALAIRSSETDFQFDHFRGSLRPGEVEPALNTVSLQTTQNERWTMPDELYNGVLFQSGRFQRVARYSHLTAQQARAQLAPGGGPGWFGTYYPPALVAGDPGARDAAIHSIQACIPHRTVVPTGVEEIRLLSSGIGPLTATSRERSAHRDTFVYDMDVHDAQGQLVEQWRGLVLRQTNSGVDVPVRSASLITPYLQHRLREIVPEAGASVAFEIRETVRNDIASKLMSDGRSLVHRIDGKPEMYLGDGKVGHLSVAHSGEYSVAVTANCSLGCDLERVLPRSDDSWRLLFPVEWFMFWRAWRMDASADDSQEAATRLWCVLEALTKAGVREPAAIRVARSYAGGWIEFHSGEHTIVTCILTPSDSGGRFAFALAVRSTTKGEMLSPLAAAPASC